MRDLTEQLASVLAEIDEANRTDPNRFDEEPLALAQGRLASTWLERLATAPSAELSVACRGHHLRRWEISRGDYAEGRSGYLRWRRDNKAHQAETMARILERHRWPAPAIERVRELLGRAKLRSDGETQTLEDVACLVFLETQFGPMVDRTDHDHLVTIVAKTLRKMSPAAIDAAGEIELGDAENAVLTAAVASLESADG